MYIYKILFIKNPLYANLLLLLVKNLQSGSGKVKYKNNYNTRQKKPNKLGRRVENEQGWD